MKKKFPPKIRTIVFNKKKHKKLGHGPGCKTQSATLGKHYTGRSKKKLSEKQLANLAKGRKVLSFLRTGKAAAEPLEPLLITEGRFMAKRKAKKTHGAAKHGKGKKVYHKVSHALHGDSSFNPMGIAVDIAGVLAGMIGLSLVSGMLPVKNSKIRSMIPLALGIAGLSMPKLSKNRFINRAALGGLAIGGYSLTKQLVPQIPLMGGTDTAEGIGYAIQQLPEEEKAILGLLPDYSGEETPTYEGETQYAGNQPGEMLGNNEPGEMLGTEMIEGIPGEMLGNVETELIGADSDFE